MKRLTRSIPGYDCLFAPCQHTPKDDHGIHGEEWRYISIANDRLTALALTVFTDIFPSTVPLSHTERYARRDFSGRELSLAAIRHGSDISLHTAFPTEKAIFRDTMIWTGVKCEFVEGGQCSSFYSSSLDARKFFAEHGDPRQLEQPISFWEAFEFEHSVLGDSARNDHVDLTHEQCPRCGGVGVVEKVK